MIAPLGPSVTFLKVVVILSCLKIFGNMPIFTQKLKKLQMLTAKISAFVLESLQESC